MAEIRAGFKGVQEIRYPSNDTILRFGSKNRAGELRLDDETGKFRFTPGLEVEAQCNLSTIYGTDQVTIASGIGDDAIITEATNSQAGIMSSSQVTALEDSALKSSVNVFTQDNTFENVTINESLTVKNTSDAPQGLIIEGQGDSQVNMPGLSFYNQNTLGTDLISFDNSRDTLYKGGDTAKFFTRSDKLIEGANVTLNKNATTGEVTITAAGGGSGATNLGHSETATTVTVTSDTGTDAVLPAATVSLAGVMSAADKTNLNNAFSATVSGQYEALSWLSGDINSSDVMAVEDASDSYNKYKTSLTSHTLNYTSNSIVASGATYIATVDCGKATRIFVQDDVDLLEIDLENLSVGANPNMFESFIYICTLSTRSSTLTVKILTSASSSNPGARLLANDTKQFFTMDALEVAVLQAIRSADGNATPASIIKNLTHGELHKQVHTALESVSTGVISAGSFYDYEFIPTTIGSVGTTTVQEYDCTHMLGTLIAPGLTTELCGASVQAVTNYPIFTLRFYNSTGSDQSYTGNVRFTARRTSQTV